MKESIKMADLDGFLRMSQKIQRTKILPLRWFGNACSAIATRSLLKAFYLDEEGVYGYRFKFHSKVWVTFNKPYERWGTYYTVDTSKWKSTTDD
jgi:hypothetical protein